MAKYPVKLSKYQTPGFGNGTTKPTIPVVLNPSIAGKFNYVWNFTNSIYDKDLVNGLSFDPAYTEVTGIKQPGHGECADFSSTDTLTIYPQPTHSMSGATKATVVCLFKPDVIDGNNLIFCTDAGVVDPGTQYANTITLWADNLGANTSNANCLSVNFGDNATPAARLETGANSLSAGEWATAVISYDGAGQVHVAVNGVVKSSLDAGTVPSSLGTANRFELNGTTVLDNFNGQVAFLATSDKYAATESECREWSKGVYGHFLKPAIESFAFVGAAGGADHDLLASDVESTSEVTTPALGQVHALTATSVESASEVSGPVLAEVSSEHTLLADDVESASEVSSATLGHIHVLTATSVESASEVSSPALVDLGFAHNLLADDVESTSEVTAPSIAQIHVLTPNSVESSSETSQPTLAQVHVLVPNSVESASELTAPALAEVGPVTLADLQDQITALTAIVNTLIEFHGLDPDNPHTITRTSRTSTNINVSITEGGDGSVTLQAS